MKFKDFLLSKIILICFYGISILMCAVFLLLLNLNCILIVLLAVFLVLLMVSYLLILYFYEKGKINKLNKIIKQLPEKHLLGEILPPPKSALEKEYFEIMQVVSRSAIGIAEKAEQDKDDYCAYVESWIHEIKTPLTACSLILNNGSDISKLKRELKRAENQTENILYYARLKSADKDLSIKKFSVSEVIENAVKNQADVMISAGISVEVEGDFEIFSDSNSLCFIIKQLLINCVKYSAKGKVKITALNKVITVEDDGVGIPSHELPRVTQKGFTGTNGRIQGGSTGMGLYIVQGLCELLDITLTIKSEEGKYTKVSLTF